MTDQTVEPMMPTPGTGSEARSHPMMVDEHAIAAVAAAL